MRFHRHARQVVVKLKKIRDATDLIKAVKLFESMQRVRKQSATRRAALKTVFEKLDAETPEQTLEIPWILRRHQLYLEFNFEAEQPFDDFTDRFDELFDSLNVDEEQWQETVAFFSD